MSCNCSAEPVRILGIDFGERRTGVAVSDPLGWTAQGLETVTGDIGAAASRVRLLAEQYGAKIIVVGYPKKMDGSVGYRAERTEAFISEIKSRSGGDGAEIVKWDERLTSVEAAKALKETGAKPSSRKERESGRIDVVSAVILLQSYLDSRRKNVLNNDFNKHQTNCNGQGAKNKNGAANRRENRMSSDRDDIIILIDEDGNEVEAEYIDTIKHKGSEYVVLLPKEEHSHGEEECDCADEEEVVILKVDKGADGGEDSFVAIDDEDEQDAVFNIFMQRMEEVEYDDEDDEDDDEFDADADADADADTDGGDDEDGDEDGDSDSDDGKDGGKPTI